MIGQAITTSIGTATVTRELGAGAQGAVYAVMVGGREFACKVHDPLYLTADNWQRIQQMVVQPPVQDYRFLLPLAVGTTRDGRCCYLMPVSGDGFESLSTILSGVPGHRGVPRPDLFVACCIGEQICDAFLCLHRNGYVYGDFNDCNVRVRRSTGEIEVIDNDNIVREGTSVRLCRSDYGAPELLRAFVGGPEISCSQATDAHSVAVALYQMLVLGHPFVGEIVSRTWQPLDQEAEFQAFGWGPERRGPVFQCDPHDKRNRPSAIAQRQYWNELPDHVRAIFLQQFGPGAKDPRQRVGVAVLRDMMTSLRENLSPCPTCGGWKSIDAEQVHLTGQPPVCGFCGNAWTYIPATKRKDGRRSLVHVVAA